MYLVVALLMTFELLTPVHSQQGMIGYTPRLFLTLSSNLVIFVFSCNKALYSEMIYGIEC